MIELNNPDKLKEIFLTFFRTSDVCKVLIGKDGLVEANPALYKMLGYDYKDDSCFSWVDVLLEKFHRTLRQAPSHLNRSLPEKMEAQFGQR